MNDELSECRKEVRRLTEENHELRAASETFGHLAERLSGRLVQERRLRMADRREAARSTSDRRVAK